MYIVERKFEFVVALHEMSIRSPLLFPSLLSINSTHIRPLRLPNYYGYIVFVM